MISMKYKCLTSEKYSLGKYSIITLRKNDLKFIKNWRNQQRIILRNKTILTDKSQKNYYSKVIKTAVSADKPDCLIFSFMNSGKCIGYGGLTNIDWLSKKSELSFLADTK